MKLFILALAVILSSQVFAETTPRGKIIQTEGHIYPNCRTVVFKENVSGELKAFRILDTAQGDDDVSSVVLTALVSQKDVTIFYEPGITTGCGTEPRILYITLYQ